ncbi:uncharacterized protein MONBRDRAFT_33692 [Monosiga brevicollis MX1]|uniref:PCI domain-containing protein n=1 Tax=Monosiga brevicollis TaxID=81824 RepID=A9V6W5_MONBE|nr:uncharacterized protein MONBRDRAFT_33692 [Monosiga brevicollis MX1]EDQ86687.1 predicted protein [Monosiga brevicollis MX1]|eukprot:XP_001748523.1 hypothetical protein [Monosiga brevicollis MX1]
MQYQGFNRFARLDFLARCCPPLQIPALTLAQELSATLSSPELYESACARLKVACEAQGVPLPANMPTEAEMATRREQALMAEAQSDQPLAPHEQLGDRATLLRKSHIEYERGDLTAAARYLARVPHYCKTPEDMLQYSLESARLAAEQGMWAHVITLVNKERLSKILPDHPKAEAQFNCLEGLATFMIGKLDKSVQLLASAAYTENGTACELMTSRDLSLMCGLSALASLDRPELVLLLQNTELKQHMESCPEIRELLRAMVKAQYRSLLDILQKVKPLAMADMYINKSWARLYENIIARAMIQHVTPYVALDLHAMAATFNMELEALEEQLVTLISEGRIAARIDNQHKVLHATQGNVRAAVIEDSVQTARDLVDNTMQEAHEQEFVRLHVDLAGTMDDLLIGLEAEAEAVDVTASTPGDKPLEPAAASAGASSPPADQQTPVIDVELLPYAGRAIFPLFRLSNLLDCAGSHDWAFLLTYLTPTACSSSGENTNMEALEQALGAMQNPKLLQELFDHLSSNSEIDHPLCEECTNSLLNNLDRELRDLGERRREMNDFLAASQSHSDHAPPEEELLDQLRLVDEEIETLSKQLTDLDAAEADLRSAIGDKEATIQELKNEEQRHLQSLHEAQLDLQDVDDERAELEIQQQELSDQLEFLRRTNVLNDAFHIWFDNHFGIINGFRLGRLPVVRVDADEINAAWGQALLLLHVMSLRLNVHFSKYQLVPNGSFSRIEEVATKAKLPLYMSGSRSMFGYSSADFDRAMVAFLHCLDEYRSQIQANDPHFDLPYTIQDDGLLDRRQEKLSVRLKSAEETWTRALKLMLTDLKWCLAWLCKQMV